MQETTGATGHLGNPVRTQDHQRQEGDDDGHVAKADEQAADHQRLEPTGEAGQAGDRRDRHEVEALQRQGYDGWLVIEAFSRRDPGFASAINVWREFDPADDIWREGQRFLRRAWADPTSAA